MVIYYTGWWFQSLWKILVSWGYYSQYMENKKCSKPPTYILYIYIIHNIRSRVSVGTAGCCWGRFIRLCRLFAINYAINPRSFVDLGTNMLLFHVPSCNPEYFRYGVFKCHIIVPISSQVLRKSSIFGESQAHLDPFFPSNRHATERQAAVEAQQPVLPSRRREKVPQSAEAFRRVGRQAGVGCI